MRILVCGGRDFDDEPRLHTTLDKILEESNDILIISGMARGADSMAINWAVKNDLHYEGYPADWKKYGRAAGPIRNQQMLDEGRPDLVIAFPGGTGTRDMIRRTKKAGIEIKEIKD